MIRPTLRRAWDEAFESTADTVPAEKGGAEELFTITPDKFIELLDGGFFDDFLCEPEIKDKGSAFHEVVREYAELPPGTFYVVDPEPVHGDMTLDEFRHSYLWVGRKQYEGLVMRAPAALVNHFTRRRYPGIGGLADRQVYISGHLDIGRHASYPQGAQTFDEQGVRDYLHKRHALRMALLEERYAALFAAEEVKSMKEMGLQPTQIYPNTFNTWNEVAKGLADRHNGHQPRWEILGSRSALKPVGFIPITRAMSSIDSMVDFAARFLKFEEQGVPYSEEAYSGRVANRGRQHHTFEPLSAARQT